ncbi:uncharacterized protein LOC128867327 [Anastrepha ludens]|uniref:uncharacterized protein LOC128867327 n=1 Tax=Anastrepha ludens TaxID=28586 RepID=UPI0023AFF949|nr:uncharacterized protein LOC128867327 [Anastrepha ludens]
MFNFECNYDEKERVWMGAKQPLVYDFNCSVGKIIFNNLKNFPKNVCQVSDIDGREVTNGELLSWSIRLAQHFKKMGLRHDDVIGIVAKNSTYLSSVAVGCFMNCTPFHTINSGFDPVTIQTLFKNTAPKIIFCDGDVYEKVNTATRSLRPLFYTLTNHIDGVSTIEDLLQPTPNEYLYQPEPLKLGGAQTVAIMCSSGTTGFPKCVCLSNYILQVDYMFVTSHDVIFTNSSLDWMTGIFFTFFSSATSCKRVITNRPYTPEYLVELVKKYKITYIMAAPRHVATLVTCAKATTDNFSSIRTFVVGGGCVSLSTLNRLQNILHNGIINVLYGMTEIGFISLNSGDQNLSSVGKLCHHIEVRIVDEQGKNLQQNEIGEIYVKTGHTWNGYYGNTIETQRMQDSFGWFHTGDMGYFDDESCLFIVDRKKEIVKYQGMQYWPSEIEDVIMKMPEVEDVCVVGVYDEGNGDAAGAVVVRRKGAQLTERQVKEYVAKHLPVTYKQLHAGVVFVERLPENTNGKTSKKEVKALFATN